MTNRPQYVQPITPETKFSSRDTISLPISHLPLFRSQLAIQNGTEKNLIFRTWGGIGDQICAEPTLRFALQKFKDVNISLASELPTLFQHLEFQKVFDLHHVRPNYDRYFLFDTITTPDDTNLVWQFFSHMLVNCVDFPSLCALRCQLPTEDREIFMAPKNVNNSLADLLKNPTVLVHAGKHWETKTFPKDWWDDVLRGLVKLGLKPILIGADTDDNRGTVDVNVSGCLDLRNKISIEQSLWLCQRADVVLTNDSSPLHMAASRNPNDETTGKTWIGYVATCKHPDFITHFRRPPKSAGVVWQWREENLGHGGMWDVVDQCPNKKSVVSVEKVDPSLLRSWLPKPERVIEWTRAKLNLAY